MKRFLLSFFILSFISCVSAAQPSPLDRAKSYYISNFPLGEAAEWGRQNEGYVVSFYDRESARPVEMEFDNKGRWRETTMSIETEKLSDDILSYVAERFERSYTTAYVLQRKRKQDQYGLVVDTPTHIYTLLFSKKGELVEQYSEGLDGG